MITNEQIEAAKSGQTVEIEADKTKLVLLRQDLYEQARKIAYDDSDLTDDELQAAAARTLDDLDTAGPIE